MYTANKIKIKLSFFLKISTSIKEFLVAGWAFVSPFIYSDNIKRIMVQ